MLDFANCPGGKNAQFTQLQPPPELQKPLQGDEKGLEFPHRAKDPVDVPLRESWGPRLLLKID
jgi:hypothetical protein